MSEEHITLVRLAGEDKADVEKHTYIDNYFKEPIFLAKDAKVAVQGFQLDMFDTANIEFTTTDILSIDNNPVTIPGIYTMLNDIIEALDAAFFIIGYDSHGALVARQNVTGVDLDFGMDVDNHFFIEKTKVNGTQAKFLSQWNMASGDAGAVRNDQGGLSAALSVDDVIISADHKVPKLSFYMDAEILDNAILPYFGYHHEDIDILGMGIDGAGNYTYIIDGVTTATGVAAAPLDRISVNRMGGNVIFEYGRFGAWNILYAHPIPVGDLSEYNEMFGHVRMTAGSTQTLTFTRYTDLTEDSVDTNLSVRADSYLMGKALGFDVGTVYEDDDDPATVTAPKQLEGIISPISINLENFITSSYDGANPRLGRTNIIYVIHAADTSISVNKDLPFPIKMSLNNNSDQYIQQMRLSFRHMDGNRLMRFNGKPNITLLIYNNKPDPRA